MRLFKSAAERAAERAEKARVERKLAEYNLQKKFFLFRKKKLVYDALLALEQGVRSRKTGKLRTPGVVRLSRELEKRGIKTYPDVWHALTEAWNRSFERRWDEGHPKKR
jgi:outer membrane protein TolC